jgi:hypothetical protein
MKMTTATYDMLKDDMHTMLVHLGKAVDAISPAYDTLTMRNMWSLFNQAHIQRRNDRHPNIEANGGRCLERNDTDFYKLCYDHEDLNDASIETAFRQMIREWVETEQVAA